MAEMSSTESQWLSQLAAMRQAIMKLNLLKNDINDGICYGSNLELDFDDEDFFSAATDNIWDVISSDEEESGDDLDDINGVFLFPSTVTYDYRWIESRCKDLDYRRPGLPADEL
jgi:antiviral helicase SLH1